MDFQLSKTKFKKDFPDFAIRRITFSDIFVEEEDLDSNADDDDEEDVEEICEEQKGEDFEPVIFLKKEKNYYVTYNY